MSDEWRTPSEALRRIAEMPEAKLQPMTREQKQRIVRAGEDSAALRSQLTHEKQ